MFAIHSIGGKSDIKRGDTFNLTIGDTSLSSMSSKVGGNMPRVAWTVLPLLWRMVYMNGPPDFSRALKFGIKPWNIAMRSLPVQRA